MKPTINDKVGISPAIASPFIIFIPSSSASPNIGGITIRKENCASFALLSPNNKPVAIVLPERDNPGNTAHACARQMINASYIEMFSFWRGFA